MCKLLPSLVQEIPSGGEVRDRFAGCATFVTEGVQLANNASFVFLQVPDRRARIFLVAEDYVAVLKTRVVDTKFDELNTNLVAKNDAKPA